MAKSEIIERLGETAVLLPNLIAEALEANERAKVRLALLQEAAAQAAEPGRKPRLYETERRASGLDDTRFDQLVSGARSLDGACFSAPGADALVDGLWSDLRAMLTPLTAARASQQEAFSQRLAHLVSLGGAGEGDQLDASTLNRLAGAGRADTDTVHRLIMDMHRAINRLAAETAVEDLDGAKVHHLKDWDRPRVRAFMRGLDRTAFLAFGHPGLGTTAAQAADRLTIQNDIGETEAHVLVLHVEGLKATVTYTDVHRRRAKFFMGLFDGRVEWTPLAEQKAEGLGETELFYLVSGRFTAPDETGLDSFLELVGSRIVFLIDWNKARKTLQTFVSRDSAVDLLNWGALHGFGHRAFLELGGADLIFEAVRRAAAGRVPYGVRLEQALGESEAIGFLRHVLRETSEGLRTGRSARLIRDEVQTDLAQRFETAETAVLAIVVRHLGLSRTLAAALADVISAPKSPQALADRAKRLEAKADRLTLEAREMCARLQRPDEARRLVDEVENAMDALDECAFMIGLSQGPGAADGPMSRLAEIVVDCIGQLVRGVEAASRLPEGRREDALAALQAIDAAAQAERDADLAERSVVSACLQTATPDARALVVGLEIARALEASTDHIAHAAYALRERVLQELSV